MPNFEYVKEYVKNMKYIGGEERDSEDTNFTKLSISNDRSELFPRVPDVSKMLTGGRRWIIQLSLIFCESPYSWTLHGSAIGNHPWSGGKPFQLLATIAGWPAGGATPTPTSRDVTNQAEYVAEKRCHDDDRWRYRRRRRTEPSTAANARIT